MRFFFVLLLAPLFVSGYRATAAETSMRLSPLVVTASRIRKPGFDTPTSISSLSGAAIQSGPPSANLAQSLARVPGIVAQNRQDYAQDLQISLRGFGARAAFGVRGLRLLIDGIPITTPGGSSETDIVDLAAIKRIEVLRGPFSALYGNSSGGVIQFFTADGAAEPTFTASGEYGSFDTYTARVRAGGQAGGLNYLVEGSRFLTNGYRQHSAARQDRVTAKFEYTLGENSSIALLYTTLSEPYAFDPSGLTRAQMKADPRRAVDRIFQFNSRESVYHRQGGIVYRQQLDDEDSLKITPYLGTRDVVQFLPFSGGSGLSGGGVVDLNRDFFGIDARFTRNMSLLSGPLTLTAGVDYHRDNERRRGYVNDDGLIGALRRNENDISHNFGEYVQSEWQFVPRASLTLGLRHSFVKFHTLDHFISAENPDDSGSVSFSRTNPVAGLLYKLTSSMHLYANYGRGFETPTLAELAYRPGGRPGLNFALKPSVSNNYEVGIKTQPLSGTRLDLALYKIDTGNEIVVDTAANGRTSYQNAGNTQRYGAELSLDSTLGHDFETHFSYSYLHARFKGGALDGRHLPGVPSSTFFAELSWKYHPLGLFTALDGQYRDRVFVNDGNTQATSSYAVFNWRASFTQHLAPFKFKEYVHLNNLLDRKYAGAVIVNAGNGRFYEPAPGRNYLVGVSASYSF